MEKDQKMDSLVLLPLSQLLRLTELAGWKIARKAEGFIVVVEKGRERVLATEMCDLPTKS